MNPLKAVAILGALVLLLVGPVLVYMGLGMLWLWERGWVILSVATTLWVIAGIVFSILAARWTKSPPPDDASARLGMRPRPSARSTGTPGSSSRTRPTRAKTLSYEALLEVDTYINSGKQLFQRLAAHYHPDGGEPDRRRAARRALDRAGAGRPRTSRGSAVRSRAAT